MTSTQATDPWVLAALWTGTAALALTLVLAAEIVFLRIRMRRAARREQAVIQQWRPLFAAAIAEDQPRHVPRVARQDRVAFLKLWVHLQASLRGSASRGLIEIGLRARADRAALRLLAGGNRSEALLGILTLGHLRDARHWDALVLHLDANDSLLSIYTGWAMVQADPWRAADMLVPRVLVRADWPLAQVVTIMQDGGAPLLHALEARLPALTDGALLRALRIMEGLRATLPPELHERLLGDPSMDVLIAALRLAAGPGVLPRVRALAAHEDWRVRVHAARTLGRIGESEDVDRLRTLLADSEWWVRHRAAEALASLPFLTPPDLEHMAGELQDRYGSAMLRHILALAPSTGARA
ncbi:HEAT repeat domain-containing protein [Massilia arenosa]|uniref:HEAT repeat domain-containing protein n=1 Tax=Zemynaea arenosa TaxID=2561931 RepID=A0A4Y9RW24_9BURK|nr:HEAT repeat domain-containing protein [Massilia arenosa]TFW11498.1 HEAT repeat domain-containing protein [Massilia arenosa]